MKKIVMRPLAVLLVVALAAGMLLVPSVQAEAVTSGQCGMDVVWYFDEATGTLIVEGTGELWDFDLAELAPWAALAKDIKKIVVSSGVTAIGKNAFSGSEVKTIELPDTLTTIKEGAFTDCAQLEQVDLSKTQVTTIEADTFAGCGVKTVAFPETLTTIKKGAFKECAQLEQVDLSKTQVTTIEADTFAGCGVKTVAFPETLTTIKEGAFAECAQLEEVDLSKTQVTTIEANAFTSCPALTEEKVALPDTVLDVADNAFDQRDTAPAVGVAEPTEATVPPTEPTAPSTEPTEPSTEPTAPSTEPTVPPTEPPFSGEKTYTTRDHGTVTETWVDGVVVEKTVEYPHLGSTKVYSDFDANGNPGKIQEKGANSVRTTTQTYDEAGRLLRTDTVYVTNGTSQSNTTEYTYTSATEGVAKRTNNGSSNVMTGSVRLHENGQLAELNFISDGIGFSQEYDQDGIVTREVTYSAVNKPTVALYQDGILSEKTIYDETNNNAVLGHGVTQFSENGLPVKYEFAAADGADLYEKKVEILYDGLGREQTVSSQYNDGYSSVIESSNGLIVSGEYKDANGEVYKTSQQDENGNLTVHMKNEYGTMNSVTIDPEGRPIEKETYLEDGSLLVNRCQYVNGESWNYTGVLDTEGNVIHYTNFYRDENGAAVTEKLIEGVYTKSISTKTDSGLSHAVIYDKDGNTIEEHYFNGNGEECDADGNVLPQNVEAAFTLRSPAPENEEPAEAEEPTEDEEPTEGEEPTEAEEPTEDEKPTEGEEPTESEEPTEGEEPAETEEPTEDEEPTEGDAE